MSSTPHIVEARSPEQVAAFASLCREYAASLPQIGLSLEVQGFEQEMATLPGKYAPPRGTIVLVEDIAQPGRYAGCAAVRPLTEPGVTPSICELKRMYIRPTLRGHGLGHALGARAVAFARAAGYDLMRLDTDNNMHAAIAVYTRLGFKTCARYNDDPCECTLWFELDLRNPGLAR